MDLKKEYCAVAESFQLMLSSFSCIKSNLRKKLKGTKIKGITEKKI